jgi:hypothetical protein
VEQMDFFTTAELPVMGWWSRFLLQKELFP